MLRAPRSLQIRKRRVQDTIKNIEAKQKPKKLVPLRIRLIRAGLSMKPRSYYLLSCLAGLVGGFIVLVTGSSPLVSLLAAFACGFGLPRWILARMIKRRQASFLLEFANSIDIIVRGIKSGLALSDCMQIIAKRITRAGEERVRRPHRAAEGRRSAVGRLRAHV